MGLRTARNNIVVTACEGVITLFGAIVLSLVGFLGPFDASLTVAPRTGKYCAANKQTSKQASSGRNYQNATCHRHLRRTTKCTESAMRHTLCLVLLAITPEC